MLRERRKADGAKGEGGSPPQGMQEIQGHEVLHINVSVQKQGILIPRVCGDGPRGKGTIEKLNKPRVCNEKERAKFPAWNHFRYLYKD